MRVKLPLGRSLFFFCAFLFSLAGLLPLRLVIDWLQLDQRGFAAREVNGSVWLGSLTEAQVGRVALGDLQASLRTFPLLLGRAHVDLNRPDEADRLEGGVSVSRNSFGIEDLTARLDLAAALAPLPIGAVDVNDVSARFVDGLCAAAEGTVRANVAGAFAGLMLPSGLSGNARCDEGALLLPLVSQSGMEAVNFRVFDNGRYEMEFSVKPADDAMRDRLVAAGFLLTNKGYALRASGQF